MINKKDLIIKAYKPIKDSFNWVFNKTLLIFNLRNKNKIKKVLCTIPSWAYHLFAHLATVILLTCIFFPAIKFYSNVFHLQISIFFVFLIISWFAVKVNINFELFYKLYKMKKLKAGDLVKIKFNKYYNMTSLWRIDIKRQSYDAFDHGKDYVFINYDDNSYDNIIFFLIKDPIISTDWKMYIRFFNPYKKNISKVKVLFKGKFFWADPHCLEKINTKEKYEHYR